MCNIFGSLMTPPHLPAHHPIVMLPVELCCQAESGPYQEPSPTYNTHTDIDIINLEKSKIYFTLFQWRVDFCHIHDFTCSRFTAKSCVLNFQCPFVLIVLLFQDWNTKHTAELDFT